MYLILLSLNILLVLTNLVGLTLLVRRFIPHYLLAKACGVLVLCLLLFFIEHFVGLGRLNWLWPITTAAAIYLIYRERASFKLVWKSELVFVLGFAYALLWRGAFPDIYPSSERVTDLYFISNYLPGATLPPLDNWIPPLKFNFYYAFQHYAAALMGRIFNLDGGTAYNLAFCILMALSIACAWAFVAHFCRRPAARALVMLAFVMGGTGVSPMVHFLIDEQQFHRPPDLWASMRFAGDYDRFLNTPLAATLFPKAANLPAGFEPRDLPVETFSYLFYVGDYHPPLGSFFLLVLTLALMAALEDKKQNRFYAAVIGLTVPAMLITNTWIFPLQLFLLIGWLAYRYWAELPTDWLAVAAGFAGGFLLAFPFLIDFAGNAQNTPIRLVAWQDHTPLAQFIALHWPLLLLGLLATLQKDTHRFAFFLGLLILFGLGLSEMVYVDDPTGGKYERTNSTMKWWGWMYAAAVVALGAVNLAAKQKAVRYGSIATLLLLSTYSFDLARDWFNVGKASLAQLHGHAWLTRDNIQRDMIQFLRAAPDGIVLESNDRLAYSNTTTMALYSGKPSMQGWPDHLVAWRGPSTHVRLRHEQTRQFYAGEKNDAVDWLRHNQVRYVMWNHVDDAKKPGLREAIDKQLSAQYQWKSFLESGPGKVGMWILR